VIRLAIRVARPRAETLLAELVTLVPAGFEERDVDDATVEYVLYGAAGELPELPTVRALAGDALVELRTSELPDDWDERWRSFHAPLDVGPLRVRPPWAPPRDGALDIVIEPGQAFGTGSHATTRLVLELLATLAPEGELADWGCGSGVLAIAAAKLGWTPVVGCDVERESVAATEVAARENDVAAVRALHCDLLREPGPYAPTVLANLIRPLLLAVAARLERVPERLIASGLLVDEVDEVVAAFAPHGLRERRRVESGGWAAVELVRAREGSGARGGKEGM